MVEQMRDEVKKIYGEKREAVKEKADGLRREINTKIDLKKNESYKEVESK